MNYNKYIVDVNPLEFCNISIVEQLYNKNQFVIRVDGRIFFQSYDSQIAFIMNDELYINVEYINYSKTTSKHLYLFIRDYTEMCVNNLKDLNNFIKRKFIKLYRY